MVLTAEFDSWIGRNKWQKQSDNQQTSTMASDMRLSEPGSNDGNLMKGMDERARKNGSLAMGKEDI